MDILCGKRRISIPSPLTGTVVAANDRLMRDPSLLNRDPYVRGWLVAVDAPGTPPTGLVNGEAARSWFARETHRLSRFFERELGVAAADGGEFVAPGPTLLSEEQWHAVTEAFLKPPQE